MNYRPHQLQDVTQFLTQKYMGRNMVMIDCFWGYSLYPFGTRLKVVHETYTGYNHTVKYYSILINETRLAVIGTIGELEVNYKIRRSLFQSYANNIVFNNTDYIVIEV
jgi:hypothetical protein